MVISGGFVGICHPLEAEAQLAAVGDATEGSLVAPPVIPSL